MTWKVEYLASAARSFKKIDPQQRRRIRAYLEERVVALDHPRQLGKPLRGELTQFWRYRVGDYRIICQIQDDRLVVLVVRAAHRKDVYE
ncbi:type II toxin-antitoxin system RelE family toxin [Halomonas ventosae]|uniref:mRNA interferase RelE/StbE n=1 Tax=Halomonas ventosae TaxID=229007 RepID=A0A2T0VGB5_9GAMM|nr:type II toxin-antitoxin system RelE/ParE family toxin [Halomonas ventosae]PRY69212.1 mRNA interferase RelE/StbE [Halomonas ventosae]